MLEVKDLHVSYGMIQAIQGVSFEVNEGEVITLIGANGAGKTTILHTVTGLLKPKSGSIIFEGKELSTTAPHKIVKYGMAHVPEGRRVFAGLTVYENLIMGAYTRSDKNEIEERIESALQQVGMSNKSYKMPHELSGGEQQRIVIARALLNKPTLVLADEPTGNLDPDTGNQIVSLLHEIAENGTTVIMATHNLNLIEQFPGKVIRCEDKQVIMNN